MSDNAQEVSICPIHQVAKICPKCRSAKGGRNRAKNATAQEIKQWGRQGGKVGGRGNKKLATPKAKKKTKTLQFNDHDGFRRK